MESYRARGPNFACQCPVEGGEGSGPLKQHNSPNTMPKLKERAREEKEGKKEGGEKGRSVLRRRTINKRTCRAAEAEETCRENPET